LIYQLILNTLIGAGTGYITNNIAIKMLFKKYFGRFGGIIEDTHDEFVANISELIEKDLINHTTLKDEFNSEEFHLYIKKIVHNMFIYSLPKNSVDLKDIKGVYKTTDNILQFLDDNQKSRKELKKELTVKPLKSAVSYSQILHLCKNIVDVLNENKDGFINELLPPLKKLEVETLLSKEFLDKISKNLNTIIYEMDLSKFDKNIDASVYALLDIVNIEQIIDLTQAEIQNLYFRDMFLDSNEATQDLIKRLIEISLSEDGQNAIKESVSAVLDSLGDVEISILSLFDDDIKENIKLFIKNEFPNIINKIIEFMNQNEKDLEELINSSIDKALDDGLFSDLKKKIVSIFYTNIVADFKILNMIKMYLHEYSDLAEDEIVTQVLDILENRSIGELYKKIANKNILTPEKVSGLIINNLRHFNVDRNLHIIDNVLQKQVKDYSDVDLSFVPSKLIPSSLQTFKSEYIYTTKIKDLIFKESENIINESKIKTLDELLGNRFDEIFHKISTYIDNDKLLNIVLSNASSMLDKPINEIVDIKDVNLDYHYFLYELIESKSLKDIIKFIESEEVYEAIKDALIKIVNDNLEDILRGNVSEAVKSELAKLPPSQIKDMVEEFMGEELKPINYFGAVLGGIAGAGVGVLPIPVFVNPLLYGVVGVATNYLAIKMLFQPYSPLKIGKMKIPFSEGVLPSNKEKMAIKMSEFVDEFMLNQTSIHDFFTNNSEDLKSFIKLHISKDDYIVIDKLIAQNENISQEAVSLIFKFLDANQDMIIEKIFNISMHYFDNREEYSQRASDFIYKEFMKKEFKEFLYEQFDTYLDKTISLKFIKKDVFKQLDIFIKKAFTQFIDILSDSEKLRDIVINFEDKFHLFINENSLLNIIDEPVKQKLTKKINSSLLELFYTQETFDEVLNFFTKDGFSSNSKLSDMINGMLPRIIENNLGVIINDTILPALKEHKKIIRHEIMQKVPFGVGWAVKGDIDRTINIILDEKIPYFLDDKIKQINAIVQEVLGAQLIELGYTKEVINQKKVNDLMQVVLKNKNFEVSFAKAMDVFVNTVFNMKLKTILQIFNITKLSQIYDLFEVNINHITELLNKNVKSNELDILKIVKNLTKDEIVEKLLEDLSIGDILKDIDKDMFLREFEYLENGIKTSKDFEKKMHSIVEKFMNIFIKKEFLDKKILKDDLEIFLKELIKDKEQFRDILTPFFKRFIVNINTLLDLKLKDNMVDIIIEASFESIEKNIMDLMGAIDFKKVITKEIRQMHPKELEDMFYSFAGTYFNKLILYGSLGILFGLATII